MKRTISILAILAFSFGIAGGLQYWMKTQGLKPPEVPGMADRAPAKMIPSQPPPYVRPPFDLKPLTELGMLTVPLACKEDKCSLHLTLDARGSRAIADMEGVRADLALSHEKRMLISLEAPSTQGFQRPGAPGAAKTAKTAFGSSPLVHALSAEAVFHRQEIDFPLQLTKEPQVLGIYLCKDSANEGHCSGKPAVGVLGVIQAALHGSRQDPNFEAPDKTYIFQLVVVGPDGSLSWFREGHDETTKRYDRLAGALSKYFEREQRGELFLHLYGAGRHTEILTPMPLELGPHGPVLPLPYNSNGFLWRMASKLVARLPDDLKPPRH